MNVKLSRFNVFWKDENGFYVSNTLSKCLIKLNEEYYDKLQNNGLSEIEAENITDLKEAGVLVDKSLDEIGMLRYSHEQSKRASNEIEIVFAPTLSCNFRCSYCFEIPRTGIISSEKEDEILIYIEKEINDNNCRKIRFIWFGGEPLLCCDVIERFTKKMKELCIQKNLEIAFSLITNGYLLTKEIVTMLETVGILHVQITIDGCKEIHDSRRKLIDGKGTFDKIYSNLSLFANSKIDVAIRINLDEENFEQYDKVVKIISELGLTNIKCHPALVEKTENQSHEQQQKCIIANKKDAYENSLIHDYYCKQCKELDNVSCACSAEHINSMVIDEKGNVYKCWNSIGHDDQIYKKTYDSDFVNPQIVSTYLGRDPFTEDECKECNYLPICSGGCLYHWLNSKHHKCTPKRFLYKELIMSGKEET